MRSGGRKCKSIKFVSEKDGQFDATACVPSPAAAAAAATNPEVGCSGSEVRAFYETLLAQPSTAAEAENSKKCSGDNTAKAVPVRLRAKSPEKDVTSLSKMLTDAAAGNLRGVRKCLSKGIDSNECDQYGWTALMCASFAGHLQIVKYLLSQGANVRKKSRSGETAADLALKGGYNKIYEFITKYRPVTSVRKNLLKKPKKRPTEHFCEACQCKYTDETHLNSVAHLLETRKPVLDPGYGIPEWNRGYRMLRKSGWDEYEGLGRDAQGRRYPVKAVLKHDRLGLGCTQEATPSNEIGTQTVKTKVPAKIPSKREHMRRLRREKNRERNFRNMLKDSY